LKRNWISFSENFQREEWKFNIRKKKKKNNRKDKRYLEEMSFNGRGNSDRD